MPGDPVFDQNDRVNASGELPPELQGKTPAEIARYYQQREQTLRQQAADAIATARAGDSSRREPLVSRDDFDNDPLAATQRIVSQTAVTRGEWDQMTGAVRNSLIASARDRASRGKKYWDRLSAEIERTLAGVADIDKVNDGIWETAYNEALGRNYSTIQQEETAAAAARAASSAEPPSGGSTPPTPPRALTEREQKVVAGLGITEDLYRKGEERIANQQFPFTYDSAAARRRA